MRTVHLLFLLLALEESLASCPLPFRKAGRNMCLLATRQQTSWYQARSLCRSAGGDLVNLRSDAEYAAVRAFAKKAYFLYDDYWTSLKRQGRQLVWQTEPNNSYRGTLRAADLYVIKPVRNCFFAYAEEMMSKNTIRGAPCSTWMGVICYRREI